MRWRAGITPESGAGPFRARTLVGNPAQNPAPRLPILGFPVPVPIPDGATAHRPRPSQRGLGRTMLPILQPAQSPS